MPKINKKQLFPYCGSIGLFEAKHSYNTWTHPTFMKETVQPTLSTKVRCVNSDVFRVFRPRPRAHMCLLSRLCVCLDGFCVLDFDDLLPLKYDWPRRSQGFCRHNSFNAARTFRIAASCWHVIWEMCSAGDRVVWGGIESMEDCQVWTV